MTRQQYDPARPRDESGPGKARLDKTRFEKTRFGKTRFGGTRHRHHGASAAVGHAKGRQGNGAIRSLNHNWRRKNAPTNVLSFPSHRNGRETPRHLGDIVIAYQTTVREAKAERKPFQHHLAHLAVHGFLHLIGYDHEADDEAEVMENLEISVLARLRVPNPYVARESLG
jgi:rRNA maturation RNase YbeY